MQVKSMFFGPNKKKIAILIQKKSIKSNVHHIIRYGPFSVKVYWNFMSKSLNYGIIYLIG